MRSVQFFQHNWAHFGHSISRFCRANLFHRCGQPQSERVDIDASIDQVRQALPLPPMPLAVLTKTEPFRVQPGSLPTGITLAEIDTASSSAQRYFVEFVPTTPQIFATGSDHYVQLSQPDLVINATRLVISWAAASTDSWK